MAEAQAPIRVLVVDDEPLARRTLRALLAREEGVELVGEAGDGQTALSLVRELAPDLVFLDIQMPEMDGFAVLRALGPDEVPAVVFVTAYDAYAVHAFDAEAADYLLKPYDDERFTRALARARARVGDRRVRELAARLASLLGGGAPAPASRSESPAPPSPSSPAPEVAPPPPAAPAAPASEYAERIVLKDASRVTFLEVAKVDWIEASDYVVVLHAGGARHMLREPLRDLEARLDPRRFVRIHRSAIVNIASVRELQPLFHGDYVVILRDGTRLRLSRTRRERLEAMLGASL